MYISLKWVQNLIDLNNIPLSVLCERLTLAGFEIEEITKKRVFDKEDLILDVSLTANRSDLFNVEGFIRELDSIFFQEVGLRQVRKEEIKLSKNVNFSKKGLELKPFIWEHLLQKQNFYETKKQVENASTFEGCFTFFTLESTSLEIKSAPLWIQKYLISSNITPINNIVDTLSFVRLETGYPFFTCDLNKLKNFLNTSTFSYSTRRAEVNQQFIVEPEKILILQPNNLLLYINNKLISVIGLLNLKEIEIDETTENILIYGGLFDPVQIRKSSQSLGIRTEQSISLEKNLNLNGLEQAFIRLTFFLNIQGIKLSDKNCCKIYELNNGNKSSFVNYVQNTRPKLKLHYKQVENILGSSKSLTKNGIQNILKALNFQILSERQNYCEVLIPFSRDLDIEREIDIIEEIVRMNGFTNFLSVNPSIKNIGSLSKLEKLKRLLRKSLVNLGLNEVSHYSLSTLQSSNQLELKNPIVVENSYFRLNLLNQLISKASLNKKQKNNALEAFEIGRTYHKSKNGNIRELELISGIFGGNLYRSDWSKTEKSINWFQAKGLVNKLFQILDIHITWSKLKKEDPNFFHPGRTAELYINNNLVGIFGQIHPTIAKLNLLNEETFLFEFNLEILDSWWNEKKLYVYRQYSLYPVSSIDLACIKNNNISFHDIKKRIYQIGVPLLESINLFDYYSGSPIPQGYHSLGLKLKFRNLERTLTNEEVDPIIKKITKSLKEDFDIIIRD